MSIADDKRPADELDGTRSLSVQFKNWRERDWFVLGYPPQRPSPYWFSLATDAVWMSLLLMEQGIGLMQRMTVALENQAKPKATPLPGDE
jgi:hypothetical protein